MREEARERKREVRLHAVASYTYAVTVLLVYVASLACM